MALGATRSQLMRTIMNDGARLTAIGLSLGVLGAAGSVRLLESMLFDITPLDAATFALVVAGLGLIALAACYLPAHRAATIEPAAAIRNE